MIPLSVPQLGGNALRYVKRCIDTNWVSSAGKFVTDFEDALCRYTGAGHAVAVVNGTCGLQLALRLCGVAPGDEVIVPALTFIAPVNAVSYAGAEPVFMDCDDYLNIDSSKLQEFCSRECRLSRSGLRNRKTGRTVKAVIPVHVFGNPCGMDEISRIAGRYHLKVVEDATESLGSHYSRGRHKGLFCGCIGDAGIFSFNGNKIITTGGGGMFVSNNRLLADKARYLVDQAKDDPVRYVHNEIGYNFRLTNLQAALGVSQLELLNSFIRVKKRNYETYRELLSGIPGLQLLGIPDGTVPNYWFYSLIVDKNKFGMGREELMMRLGAKGIQTRPVWMPNHRQKPYRGKQAYRIEKAVSAWEKTLNIPCSSGLTRTQVEQVVSTLRGLQRKK